MTDQLMDNLTNEEHEALLLMSEHAIAPPLSPAAQAVVTAFGTYPLRANYIGVDLIPALAAALRAAARYCKRDSAILLSLADELEAKDLEEELEAHGQA
jgi:hypothetical protein